MWGYTPIPGAKTPDEEKPTLDKWAKEQDDKPWLRFSTANSAGCDPGEETEAVGDADAVKATALGVKNLQRVTKMLMSATAYKEGETYDQLAELYGRMLSQWSTEMNHVAQHRRRLQQSGEGGRPGRPHLQPDPQGAPAGSREVPGRHRLHHAHLDDR